MSPVNPANKVIPDHLKKYVVEQDYARYTPIDQSVWRYCLRQLRAYLTEHAHPLYLEGLEKTGIEINQIPNIDNMSTKLSKFGWTAVPVSGFIPPAAFMELQSLSILPIAQDIRSVETILYTPAPDIVHEAAGHAPILVDAKFAEYLTNYASVANKAIISSEDFAQYEAIRKLSDIKEDPAATEDQIAAAENALEEINKSMSYVSEAGWLGRMNWWTAEYGLIGDLNHPKIFGAGLLSSVGEAQQCLSEKVEKKKLTVDCVEQGYDITEPQPQLFVTPDFEHLSVVLEDLAQKMAFRIGGKVGLERAQQSKTVNTIVLNTGLQISGKLTEVIYNTKEEPVFFKLDGASQIGFDGRQLEGHGKEVHSHGYSTPLGRIKTFDNCLSQMSTQDLKTRGIEIDKKISFTFESGIELNGVVQQLFHHEGQLIMIRFADCQVFNSERVFFEPDWGVFDLALGTEVTSVFGGPADRKAYGMDLEFVAKKIPAKKHSDSQVRLQHLYQCVRECRESLRTPEENSKTLEPVIEMLKHEYPDEWLLRLEIVELSEQGLVPTKLGLAVRSDLLRLILSTPDVRSQIEDGLKLASEP